MARADESAGTERDMIAYARLIGQFVVVLLLFSAVTTLASWPIYRQVPEGSAIVLLTFVHGADRKADCRRLSPAEIAKLPPNMRKVQDCPRGRRPVHVELDLSGRNLFRASLPPTGIAGDGPSRVYQRFVVPSGQYEIAARLRDTARAEGFDHARKETVELTAGQMLVVDFRAESGGFVFR
jgi:hypothetical protein